MGKICLIYNYAQHYRSNIFALMDKELDCDFVFGDNYLDVKKMDYSLLKNVAEVKNVKIGPFVWQRRVIRRFFKSYDSYIMLGQPNFIVTWIVLLLSKFSRKKTYLWSHGWYGRESFFKRLIKKAFFGLADGVFVYGDYARDLMVKEGFDEKKLFAIHNSLDYDKQLEIRKGISPSALFTNHFGNTNPNLIFIGRLTEVKRLDMILDVLKQSKTKYNLTYIGAGEDEQRLKHIVKDYNIENQVWFYGACYQESELSKLIYNADLCIAPGNVGLTSIHCLTYGCPVITHNNFPMQMPEFEVIKQGVTGDYFEYNDIQSLADTIDNWFMSAFNRENIRQSAFDMIDKEWNPYYQLHIIKTALKSC